MNELINCLKELTHLKAVYRGNIVNSRNESSADHSWSCMLIADVLIDYIDESLDRAHVLELLLYHDLVEIYAGDAKFNSPKQMGEKDEKEKAAFERITALIPDSSRYKDLLSEYEERKTREALFAKAVDCIDALISTLKHDGKTPADGFTEELIRNKYKPWVEKFEFIDKLFEEIMKLLNEQGKI